MYQAVPATKGIAIHIEAPNLRISWNYATGWADSRIQRKLTSNNPALIASIKKMYLSAAIIRLVELNTIQLNQSISELLPAIRIQ